MDCGITSLDKIKSCIKNNQNFVLQGGAGSGKTETLKQLLEFLSESYPGKKIACITHTNLAVDEIKSRVGDQYTISTIHSFLNSLTKDYKKNIQKVIFDIFKLSNIERKGAENYDDEKQQKKEEFDNYKKTQKKYADKLYTVKNESTKKVEGKRDYDKDPEGFNRILNEKINILNKEIKAEIESKDFYNIKYNETRFDDFNELTFGHDSLLEVSYLLFDKYEILGKILQDKYDFIFIDEYQDTNEKIIDIFLKKLPLKEKTIVGLFGDSMQAIYEDGVGDVEKYIDDKYLVKIIKEDNYRCSEEVIKFINQLRNDGLKQQVAFKVNKDAIKESLSDRQGSVKLYYSIYDNKPNVYSNLEDKANYENALNTLIEKACHNQENYKTLMLTNKSIAGKAGFGALYDVFAARYLDPKEQIDNHLLNLQFLDLFELCNAYELKNFNFILDKLNKSNFSIKRLEDKIKLKKSFEKIINSDKGALETLEMAFKLKLIKVADKNLEYSNRKKAFLKELEQIDDYQLFKSIYNSGNKTFAKIKDKMDFLEEDAFKDFENKLKKEAFYVDLFSDKIKFKDIMNYFKYVNEETQYITMHKTKGSGIDNVIVVLDEYFWNQYNFNLIFDSNYKDEKKKLKNQRLAYVACSRAITNLTCVKLISKDEEIEIKKFFKDPINVEIERLMTIPVN
ncbi:UvrD-helicase domain-containing protein [Peribacillus sp. S4]|uniref:UvrD-helicase domain-containing protein n=1 Tax=Peribacillus sp. S4 TaxID=3384451 RepID=UPI0039893A22